jgi:hypothetical protein
MVQPPVDDGSFSPLDTFLRLFGPDGPFAVLLLVAAAVYVAVRISRGRQYPSGSGPGISTSLLEALSVLAVGVLIALFVSFGIQAFYPAPQPPEEPERTVRGPQEAPPEEKEFMREMEAYMEEELPAYNRVASVIALGVAVAILAAVPLLGRLRAVPQAITDGVALGGVTTLLYGLVLALEAEGDVFKFLMVAVALLVVLIAIYLRFRPGRRGAPSSLEADLLPWSLRLGLT